MIWIPTIDELQSSLYVCEEEQALKVTHDGRSTVECYHSHGLEHYQ